MPQPHKCSTRAPGTWAFELLDKLGIPTHIFPETVPPGTRLGTYEGIPVIAPACHDTGSAVAAVPAQRHDFAYLSSGTWSLFGLELDQPVITSAALEANVTNEGGVYGTIRLLKNIMGLWLVQQCRATWQARGETYSYDELVELARSAPALKSLVNVSDSRFVTPGDMPARVQAFCQESGQPIPQSKGEIIRTILESLALAYRQTLEQVCQVSARQVNVIHIVGGGAQNKLLNQMTADATGRPVITGPIEATVIGNALVQLISLGELSDIGEARQLVAQMGGRARYEPQETTKWDGAYGRFSKL